MEFLRFGSSIPGSYWGCCAVDIIQYFNVHPSGKAAIELVHGDTGMAIQRDGKTLYAGQTYEEIFRERIRIGTFSNRDMPNHVFLAVLTESQISSDPGKKWLKILKEEGFEFIRATDNSVYTGAKVPETADKRVKVSSHTNYIFGLFRNIGNGALKDPLTPPKAWTDLCGEIASERTESWQMISSEDRIAVAEAQSSFDLKHWHDHGETRLYKESELSKDVLVFRAGQRSEFPQETSQSRSAKLKAKGVKKEVALVGAVDEDEDFD